MRAEREIWRFFFSPTQNCNLDCNYCYIADKKKIDDLTLNALNKAIFNFLKTPGQEKEIIIFGGEPMLAPKKLKDAITFIRWKGKELKKTTKITLCTNLTILDLKMFEDVDYVSVSLDGSKKSHDKNRFLANGTEKREGTWNLVLKNLEKIKKDKKVAKKIKINKIIVPNNVDFIKDDFAFLKSLGLPFYFSFAAGVSGWNKQKLEKLKKIFISLSEKITLGFRGDKEKEIFKEFFKLPAAFCPFSSMAMGTSGRLFNCEFLALNERKYFSKGFFWEEVLDRDCVYDLAKIECRRETCLHCGFVCQKFNFKKEEPLSPKDQGGLREAQNFKNFVLKSFIKKYKIKIPKQWVLSGCNESSIRKFKNVFFWLNKFLYPRKNIELFFSGRIKKEKTNKLLNKLEEDFRQISFREVRGVDLDKKEGLAFFNCQSERVSFLKADLWRKKEIMSLKKIAVGNEIGRLREGISLLNFIEKI